MFLELEFYMSMRAVLDTMSFLGLSTNTNIQVIGHNQIQFNCII